MYPDHQDLFVVGAVEDPDPPPFGSALLQRHRKSWLRSSADGCLKATTWHPCGLTPDITCLMVPSLPAASMAWSTTSTHGWCRSPAWPLALPLVMGGSWVTGRLLDPQVHTADLNKKLLGANPPTLSGGLKDL